MDWYVEHGAVGVICGRFIDRNGDHVAGPLDQRMIGIDPGQLQEVDTGIMVFSGRHKLKAALAKVLIHPQDARRHTIGQGDLVRVFNDRGQCSLSAEGTPDIQPGLLVAEGLHWPKFTSGGQGINQLTSQRLTDKGLTCDFHCSRVEIEPAGMS